MASKDQRRVTIYLKPDDEKVVDRIQKRLKPIEGEVSIATMFRRGLRLLEMKK